MMKKRWYEKNPDLTELINFIQSLDVEKQNIIAQHLLQILINECGIDLDKEISAISTKNYSYNRWYDKNYDISTALELLKNLSEVKQQFVVKRIVTEIIMSYTKEEI